MRYYFNIILFSLLIVLTGFLQSCSNSRRIAKRSIELDTVTVSAKNNPIDIFRATTTKEWEIINTSVALSFNMKEKTADGRVELTLHPYFYDTDSIRLDAKSMKIDSVMQLDGANRKTVQYRYSGDTLLIKLGRKYKQQEEVHIFIKYLAMPYSEKSGGSAAINDDRGLYFINTDNSMPGKPVQIWTQGETEANSHWVPTIDKPNQRTTTKIMLTVPDSFTTLSNGYKQDAIKQAGGMRTDVWVMDQPIQVYVMMFAIGKYAIVKDRDALGKVVDYYVEPEFEPYAREMFKNTPEMIEYFSKTTGVNYPWNKYSQVVVRDYVSGAMENTSASLFGEFMNCNHRELLDDDNEDVVSHELFHQWFGDYVTAESWSNLTLNESFATYGTQLWMKHKYGKASGDMAGIKELWSYVYGAGQRTDPALVRFYYADKEDMFDGVSYQKGASILRYLHYLVGDEAFSKSMQLYLTRNALKPAEATQWRLAVEEVTGKDWNWFFNQWYYRGGHPVLDIKYNYDDAAKKLTVVVSQTQKTGVYRLPVNVRLIYNNSSVIENETIVSRKEVFIYSYKNGARPIAVVDDEHVIVGEVEYNFKPFDWLAIYKSSNDNVINKQLALGNAKNKMDDSSAREIVYAALEDKNEKIRELALTNLVQLKNEKLQAKFRQRILYIAEFDTKNTVRAAAFRTLGEWKVNEAKEEMLKVVDDSSYAIAGAALNALYELDKDSAYPIAKRLLNSNPRAALEDAIWEIIAYAAKTDDFSLFEQRALYYYGRKKISLAGSLAEYLKNVTDDKVFDKGLNLLYTLTSTEVIKSYRISIGYRVIELADHYKGQRDNARKNAEKDTAETRFKDVKTKLEKLVSEENDDDNKATYKRYMKQL